MSFNIFEKLKIKQNIFLFVQAAFAFAFLIQSYSIVRGVIKPTETSIFVEEKPLEELPILLKICVHPGFNVDILQTEGYENINMYFGGIYKENDNVTKYGWGGKLTKNVRELYNRVRSHNVSDVISKIDILTNKQTNIHLNMSLFKLSRPNYPLPCYTLSLLEEVIRRDGVKQLWIYCHAQARPNLSSSWA